MKKFLAVSAAFFVGGFVAFANPVDLSGPGGTLGYASYRGAAQYELEYQDLDAGDGVKLPLRFIFDSEKNRGSGYGWTGWSVPLVEASSAPKGHFGNFEVTLLCGKKLYFHFPYYSNLSDDDSGGGLALPMQYLTRGWATSQDGAWRADISGYPMVAGAPASTTYTLTVTRWDGWRLYYVDGKLSTLTTDGGKVLHWNYTGPGGRLSTITTGSTTLLQVTYSGTSAGSVPTAIKVNADTYNVTVDATGRLTQVTRPDTTADAFAYVNFSGSNLATYANTSNPAGGDASLEHTNRYGAKRKLTWKPAGLHYITNDGPWDYEVTSPSTWGGNDDYDAPAVKRTRTATGEWEKVFFNGNRDSVRVVTAVDGSQTRITTEKANGPARDKVSLVQRLIGTAWTPVSISAYDLTTGRLIRSTDANGKDTVYTYTNHLSTALPHPVSGWSESVNHAPPKTMTVTDATGKAVTYTYDVRGNLLKVADAAGVERAYEYDARDRRTKVKNDAGTVVAQYAYNNNDRVTSFKDANLNETTFAYLDRYGESLLTKVTSPTGLTTEFTYDAKGNRITVKGHNGEMWTLTPNTDSLLERITDPLANHIDFAYDARRNLASVTDAASQTTSFEYDDLDLTNKITDALGFASNYQSNGDGSVKQISDNRAKIYNFEHYQNGNFRAKLTFPGGSKNVSVYDLNGRVLSWKNRAGTTVTVARDDASRVTGKSWPGGYGTSLTYDAAGRISTSTATYPAATLHKNFTYDSDGRVETVTLEGRTATLHYNADGRMSAIDYPAGFTIDYTYDGDKRISTVKLGTTVLAAYGYNAKGQLETLTNGNGVVTTYAYDKLNRVTGISAVSGATVLWAATYGYDARGNRTYAAGLYNGGGGDAYRYDNLGQLTGVKYDTATASSGYASATSPAVAETTTYDAAGNRSSQTVGATTTGYTVNDLNQYTAITGETPAYDGMGNLTSHGGWTLDYSPFGQLQSAVKSGSHTQSYGYDAFGNRAYEASTADYTRNLLYVDSQLFEVYETPAGTPVTHNARSYVYGPGIDRPICEVVGNAAALKYPLQDANGNVVAVMNSSGAVAQRYTYDAWGTPKAYDASWTPVSINTASSRFLFAGRDYDFKTGLYHYRSRAYSPVIGRFLQPDTVDFRGEDLNIYAYCGNDPVNWKDPTGKNAAIMTRALARAGAAELLGGGPLDPIADALAAAFLAQGIYECLTQPQAPPPASHQEAKQEGEENEEASVDDPTEDDGEDYEGDEDHEDKTPLKNKEKTRKERRERPKDPEEREQRKNEIHDIKRRSGGGGADNVNDMNF